MSRKTTRYARNRQHRGQAIGVVNSAAWVKVIERCQPLVETAPIVTGIARETDPYQLLIEAREALQSLLNPSGLADDPRPYNCLACIVDVTHMRALQIHPDHDTNPIYADLQAARTALHGIRTRWERLGKWGMAGQERQPMIEAVDHYEAILLASSAQQMHDMETLRIEQIKRGNFYQPEVNP